MQILLDIIAVIVGIIGILGCVLPVLPGPPISYVGMLILYIWGDGAKDELTSTVMIVWLVITLVVTVLDYVVPAYFTRITGGTKAASRASLVGMIIGIIFFPPIGMIIGAFLGALIAEMIWGAGEFKKSLKPALGSFLGFLVGTGFKLIASGVMMYYIIIAIF